MSGSPQKITLRDVAVLAFVVCVLAPAAAVRLATSRESSNRIKCASNLRQIGQAIQIYANENKGQFPRTYFEPLPAPVPTEYTAVNVVNVFQMPGGAGPNDVSASFYLLLRAGNIGSEVFLCPTSGTVTKFDPPPGMTFASFGNFASRASLSYGYTNPFPSSTARSMGFKLNYTLSSDFAIAADMGRGAIAAKVPANANRQTIVSANSPNHAGDGQNVLYADGHVDWAATPFAGSPRPFTGAPRDNIYAYGADTTVTAPSAGVRGAPQDQYDTVILPAFDMGPQPNAIPAPGSSGGVSLFPTFGGGGGAAAAGGGSVSGGALLLLAVVVLLILSGFGVLLFLLLRASRPGRYPPPPGLA